MRGQPINNIVNNIGTYNNLNNNIIINPVFNVQNYNYNIINQRFPQNNINTFKP